MEPIFKLVYEMVVTAHVAHLQSKSYAEHVTLKEVYEELPELLDSIMETYQGKYGSVCKDIGSISPGNLSNYQEHLNRLLRYLESQLPTYTLDIQDEVLTMINFLNSIKYKLTLK